jgi:hypothetical protein
VGAANRPVPDHLVRVTTVLVNAMRIGGWG